MYLYTNVYVYILLMSYFVLIENRFDKVILENTFSGVSIFQFYLRFCHFLSGRSLKELFMVSVEFHPNLLYERSSNIGLILFSQFIGLPTSLLDFPVFF